MKHANEPLGGYDRFRSKAGAGSALEASCLHALETTIEKCFYRNFRFLNVADGRFDCQGISLQFTERNLVNILKTKLNFSATSSDMSRGINLFIEKLTSMYPMGEL